MSKLPTSRGADRPTLLLNATTINKGGGIQAVVTFIRQLMLPGDEGAGAHWILAVSGEVRDQLATFAIALRDRVDLCLETSPARNRRSRAQLRDFADRNADLVFTYFGPAYVRFRCPHLCGVADGWVTHAGRLAYATLPSLRKQVLMALTCLYKALWYRRADVWAVEHELARAGLVRRLRLPARKIHVVGNNCGQHYLDGKTSGPPGALRSPVRILTFAANFPNKCLDLVPQVAAELVKRHQLGSVQFVLTLPPAEYAMSALARLSASLGVEHCISNAGYVPLKDGPALYRSCDMVLMPSVLETFSATYPESMCMGLPIATSDLPFARSICAEAAIYFAPRDAASAANALATLIRNSALREDLVAAGYRRLRSFPAAAERVRQYRRVMAVMLNEPVPASS